MNTKTATRKEAFRSVEEIVKKFFPDDIERERPEPGDLGRGLAEETLENARKMLAAKKKKK